MITPITATFPALNFPKEVDYPTQEDWAAFSAAAELNYGILSGTWSDKSEEFKAQTNNLALEIQEIGENAFNAISLDTVDDLATYNGTGLVIVKDLNRGGTFIYDDTQSAVNNSGTIFNGWVRQFSGAVNVKWFGAEDGEDSTVAIQKALLASLNVLLPEGNTFKLSAYCSIRSGTTLTIDSTIIRVTDTSLPKQNYYPSGFDCDKVSNVIIQGNGTFSDEKMLTFPDSEYPMTGADGYTPIIHIRSCTDVVVKDLNIYKVVAGIAITRSDASHYPTFEPIPYAEKVYNCHVDNITSRFTTAYAITINSGVNCSISNSYVYRSGDGGIHFQFCLDSSIHNNIRESPYGDGTAFSILLDQNDSEGIVVENSGNIRVTENTIKGCASDGIAILNNSRDVLITGNTIIESQLTSISARGGDAIYGFNSGIVISNNKIVNHGYLHSSDVVWTTYGILGGIHISNTYSAEIVDNTISGINDRGGNPIHTIGIGYDDFGFWSGELYKKFSYTSLSISNNTITFNEFRSNYTDFSGFESSDCNISGIKVIGIWGKAIVRSNNLLSNAFADGRFSSYDSIAGIEVQAIDSGAGEAKIQVLDVSSNTIAYWNGGGVYIKYGSPTYDKQATISVSGNNISNLPGYGVTLLNLPQSSLVNNTIKNVGKVSTSINYDKAVYISNSYGIFLDANIVSNTYGSVATYGYVNCVYLDSSLIYEGSNSFQFGTGDTISYLTNVNSSRVSSTLQSMGITITNAVGTYTKFANGTMISTQIVNTGVINEANGSLFRSAQKDVSLPVNFIGVPIITASSNYLFMLGGATTTSFYCRSYNSLSLTNGGQLLITAIGRWK